MICKKSLLRVTHVDSPLGLRSITHIYTRRVRSLEPAFVQSIVRLKSSDGVIESRLWFHKSPLEAINLPLMTITRRIVPLEFVQHITIDSVHSIQFHSINISGHKIQIHFNLNLLISIRFSNFSVFFSFIFSFCFFFLFHFYH